MRPLSRSSHFLALASTVASLALFAPAAVHAKLFVRFQPDQRLGNPSVTPGSTIPLVITDETAPLLDSSITSLNFQLTYDSSVGQPSAPTVDDSSKASIFIKSLALDPNDGTSNRTLVFTENITDPTFTTADALDLVVLPFTALNPGTLNQSLLSVSATNASGATVPVTLGASSLVVTVAAPEPASLALLATGTASLLLRRRRK